MTSWEHCIVRDVKGRREVKYFTRSGEQVRDTNLSTEQLLGILGCVQGWELVTVQPEATWVFKRPENTGLGINSLNI